MDDTSPPLCVRRSLCILRVSGNATRAPTAPKYKDCARAFVGSKSGSCGIQWLTDQLFQAPQVEPSREAIKKLEPRIFIGGQRNTSSGLLEHHLACTRSGVHKPVALCTEVTSGAQGADGDALRRAKILKFTHLAMYLLRSTPVPDGKYSVEMATSCIVPRM